MRGVGLDGRWFSADATGADPDAALPLAAGSRWVSMAAAGEVQQSRVAVESTCGVRTGQEQLGLRVGLKLQDH